MKRYLALCASFACSVVAAQTHPIVVPAGSSLKMEDIKSNDVKIPAVPPWVLSNNVPRPISTAAIGTNPGRKKVDLQYLPISEVVSLYFKNFNSNDYVICDSVLNDRRFVSIRASGQQLDEAIFRSVLHNSGYDYQVRGGVVSVCQKDTSITSIDPKTAPIFTYRPRHQSVDYLVNQAKSFVDGVFSGQQQNYQHKDNDNLASVPDTDLVVFSGSDSSIKRLKKLLAELDVPSSNVLIKAALFEFSKNKQDASAMQFLANLAGGGIELSAGTTVNQFLKIKIGGFNAVLSAISSDTKFSLISNPFLRLQSGKKGRLQIGDDVPVAGELLTNANGQIIQENKYISSGLILDLLARVHGSTVDLSVEQTLSNFYRNNVSDNENPILSKRFFTSQVSMHPGETVILGGLSDQQNETVRSGLFGWNFSRSNSNKNKELILVLSAERV